jgi:hypothetical protein
MAYGSTTSNDRLYVGWSSDGSSWSDANYSSSYTINTAFSPAIAFFDGYLWIAFVSDGGGGLTSGALYLGYTNSPSSGFSATPVEVLNDLSEPFYPSSSPTLAAFNGSTPKLWIAAVDSYSSIDTASIEAPGDSITFGVSACAGSANDPDSYEPATAQVGMAYFGSLMYYGYQTTDNTVRVCSTDGGSTATYSNEAGYYTSSGVSATVFGDYLTFAFKDDTGSNHVYVEGTSDGSSWSGSSYTFSMNGNNQITPAIAPFGSDLYMIFTANSSNHHMWYTHAN